MTRAFGLSDDRLLEVSGHEAVKVERLIVAARGLGNIRSFTRHAVAMTQGVLRSPEQTTRKIFLSRERSASRRITNEAEIVQMLEPLGYERVFPEELCFEDQVALFSSASHVVGALGAGLANAAFMSPGTSMIELAPEGRTGDATLFANLACQWELRHGCVVGAFSSNLHKPVDRRDFHVEAELVDKMVKTLN